MEIGNKVRWNGSSGDGPTTGQTGTVVAKGQSSLSVGVHFDSTVPGGHNLDGKCPYGMGWWCSETNLVLIGSYSRSTDKVTTHDEVEQMDAPNTQLEKTARDKAVQEAIEQAIDVKKEVFATGMRAYIQDRHEILRLRAQADEIEKENNKLGKKLGITPAQMKELF